MYKYTSNGKKWKVIKPLNSTQSIIQEVYVDLNSKEVLAGEEQVEKNKFLYDAPLKTWEEKRMEEIKANYERVKSDWKRRTEQMRKSLNQEYKAMQGMRDYLRQVRNHDNEKAIDFLVNVLSGKITHFVKSNWNGYFIQSWSELLDNDNSSYPLKTLTLFGYSKGDMQYKIDTRTEYHEGYGEKFDLIPCTSYDEALTELKKLLLSKGEYTKKIIEAAEKHNIELDKKKLVAYYQAEKEKRDKWIDEQEARHYKAIKKYKEEALNYHNKMLEVI